MRLLFILSLALISKIALCQELHEGFNAVRPLGMGGASVGLANDEYVFWTNPAGVARNRKHRQRHRFFFSKLPHIGAGVNTKAKKLYSSQSSDKELAEIIGESDELGSDKPFWANVNVAPMTMFDVSRQMPGAVALYSNTTTKMLVESDTPEQARISMISDAGGVVNLGVTNWTNRFSASVQVRYVSRYAYEDVIPTNEVSDSSAMQTRIQEGANQTAGLGVDVGGLATLADFWFPTVGFSVLNIPTGCHEDYLNPHSKQRETVCGTKYTGEIENEDALSVVDPTDIRVGLSITPRITRKMALRLALDAHHIYVASGSQSFGLSGVEPQKMLHAGVELFFGNPLLRAPLSFRFGSNQGLITSGFSVNMGFLSIDFATYGVDVSSTAKVIEDRRQVATFSLIF